MFGYYALTKPKLHREPLLSAEEITTNELSAELGAKASKVFGYKTLSTELSKKEKSDKVKAFVAKAFAEIGFEPLSTDKVIEYKDWYSRKYSYSNDYPTVTVRWEAVWLQNYTSPVPEFALSRAVELKEKFPTANFAIEHPVLDSVMSDPFLVMAYEGEVFYLEVWEEPAFEGRRTV
jgi:hypothetical protein